MVQPVSAGSDGIGDEKCKTITNSIFQCYFFNHGTFLVGSFSLSFFFVTGWFSFPLGFLGFVFA